MARFFGSSWMRSGPAVLRRKAKSQRSARLAVESLEDRTMPSITIDAAGLVSVIGTPHHDAFVIRVDPTMATQLQFSDDGGANFTSFASSSVTGVDVQGLGAHDVLTIDNNFGLVGGSNLPITYEGGKAFDELVLQGDPKGAPVTEIYSVGTTFGDGTLSVDDGTTSATIKFTSVESVVDTLTADQLTINANDNPNLIRISDGPTIEGQQTTRVRIFDRLADVDHGKHGDNKGDDNKGDDKKGNDDNGDDDNQGNDDDQGDDDGRSDDRHGMQTQAFTPITFANKTNVTINAMGGDDVFVLNNPHPADGLSQLTVDGGDGQDVLIERNVPPGVTLTTMNIEKTVSNPDDALIDELFEEDLGREADPGGMHAWESAMHNGLGLAGVVSGIENSTEARTLFVKGLYSQFLGRAAVNGEEQGWVSALMHGDSEEDVIAGITGSAEFQQRAQTLVSTGTASERTVAALYSALLGRTADAAGAAAWASQLQVTGSRSVALAFLHSAEFRASAVDTMYQSLLGRTADPAGLQSWTNSGIDLGGIRRGIEASAEFAQDE